ncbi:hypothetical protein LJY25_20665 [Hymenobacter sp. BT175]|uniref:tetratricopeptide repeat protein n=1 Tax=Hymenobacter translucens TaxID=2886507 RepID=UPI001D0E0907|nr:tetratricopeptide repeat protein [Hymenobacter translucens]MCC2548874.1 hypothetical protein [Hymenobacter translucens]
MKNFLFLAALLTLFSASPGWAQRKGKDKSSSAVPLDASSRLRPLFGGLTPALAEQMMGPAFLAGIDKSFPSRAEASKFFSNKGFEYLAENQPDTAIYRFNLAWLLDQKNADAYRGLGVISARNPTTDETVSLLTQGLALAPNDAYMLSDLGATYLIRYQQTQKKKDLKTGADLLTKALAANPNNAIAWQEMARANFHQGEYTKAWEAIHKGRNLDLTSLNFALISELLQKQPDPQGTFK